MAKANKTTQVNFGPCSYTLREGASYRITGEKTVDGKKYIVVETGACAPPLVTTDGEIAGPSHGGMYTHKPTNPMVRLIRQNEVKIDEKSGYENYEILYNGINDTGLSFTYREFSPDGLARVAFYQNLNYPKNAKNITFRNFKILIEEASAEVIVYRFLSDGK